MIEAYEGNKFKMTRKEAAEKLLNLGCENSMLIAELEALGLLKFEEEKQEVAKLCSAVQQNKFNFRVEQWFEDNPDNDKYVLWFNGEIVWRSWKP